MIEDPAVLDLLCALPLHDQPGLGRHPCPHGLGWHPITISVYPAGDMVQEALLLAAHERAREELRARRRAMAIRRQRRRGGKEWRDGTDL